MSVNTAPDKKPIRKVRKKMKNMRKWIGLLLCLALVLSLGVSAFADEEAAETETTDYGIIDPDELNAMFDEFTAKYNMTATGRSFSVGFCYLATGDTWYYNDGKWYYSASLYKVPTSMLFAEQVANGEITMDTMITTQYASGTLESLMSKAIVNSNNDAGHALVEYQGGSYSGKCADQFYQYTDLPESYFSSDFESVSYYNVVFYTQVLKTLYENPSRFPYVIDFMKQAQPGAYLRTYLEGTYEVAQKYGAFEETKTSPTKQNNHAAGIIYTPNPIIVTVMTVNIDNYNDRIGETAQMLADYALTLDSRLDAYRQEQQLAAQQEAERIAQEEQERLAAEAAAQAAAAAAAAQTSVTGSDTASGTDSNVSIFMDTTPTPAPASSSGAASALSSGLFGLDGDTTQKVILIAGAAIFVLGLILLIVALAMRARRKREEEYDEDYDDEYDEDDDYLAPPVVKNTSRSGRRVPAYVEEEDEEYDEEEAEDEEEYEEESEDEAEEEEYEEDEELEEEPGEEAEEEEPDAVPEAEEEAEEEYLEPQEDFLEQFTYEDIRKEFSLDDFDLDLPEEEDTSSRRKH